jgi:type III pantothenate kinase
MAAHDKTLCLDYGNTRQKFAVFSGGEIIETGVVEGGDAVSLRSVIMKFQPDRSILSSVINHSFATEELLEAHTKFHLLSHKSKLPVTTPVGKPDTIGADRLALVVGAAHVFGESNNLVIGLGTCITFNFVNKNKEFLGGSISPGMEIRFRSLKDYTAKLPLISADWNFPLMGYDTRTNILTGVILGMVKEIDGIIDAYKEKYRNLNVLLTGGDSAYFASHLKNKIFADPDLIFKGLYAISEYNNG